MAATRPTTGRRTPRATAKPRAKSGASRSALVSGSDSTSWILPLLLLLLSVFILFLCLWTGNTGIIGGVLRPVFLELFGIASPLLGILLLFYSLGLLIAHEGSEPGYDSVFGLLSLQFWIQLATTMFAASRGLDLTIREVYRSYGGLLGVWVHGFLFSLFGPPGLWLTLALLAVMTSSLLSRRPPALLLRMMGRTARRTLPSEERRRRLLQQSRTAWKQTREAADHVAEEAEPYQPLPPQQSLQEARYAELIALAAASWQTEPEVKPSEPNGDALSPGSGAVQDSSLSDVAWGAPAEWLRSELAQTTPKEWWLPGPGLEPDDEVVLPDESVFLPLPSWGSPNSPVPGIAQKSMLWDQSDFEAKPSDDTEQVECDDPGDEGSLILPAAEKDTGFIPTEQTSEVALPGSLRQEKGEARSSPDAATTSPGVLPRLIPVADLGEDAAAGFLPEFDAVTSYRREYLPPPLALLSKPEPNVGLSVQDMAANAELLEQTLEQFGVGAKVVDISLGPTLTRYELQLAPGVRVNKVASLADDIAMGLAALGVRIEAPIPGKAAIGIEVPNREAATVHLGEILASPEFSEAQAPLTVALGKDIAGKPIVTDLTRMPHLLIAGTTGSGKSVCLNSLIASILYRSSPEEVRLIMIDPKVVEMQGYNGIPHLLAPVVTDPKKAASVLKIATREMDRRYEGFAALGVKNIAQYNQKIKAEGLELPHLPFWVICIDELADLMMIAKEDVEQAIIRIAQLARAAGIHLVVGTQRPTTDVITGIIKANIPSRIAFAVSSGIDSRIILDSVGAEKLLGRGDMLFLPIGAMKPLRVQGAYISEQEVDAVVAHVKQQGTPVYNVDILKTNEESAEEAEGMEDRDPLFMQAAALVIDSRQGSTTYIQRRLKLGYSRAGRIMDQLQEYGVVGPSKGSKTRDVLMSREQLEQLR